MIRSKDPQTAAEAERVAETAPRTTDDPGEPAARTRALALGGLALFLVAFGLRLVHLDDSSFWQDEILQLQRTTLSLGEIWAYSPKDKPPLDYFIQALIIGDQPVEWQARLHACVFGAAFVTIFTFWAWRTDGIALAGIAFLISVASPILVRFSQEGRPYALMLMAEGLFLCVVFALRRGAWRDRTWWIQFFAVSALCLWSHYSLLLPCLAAAIPVAILRYRGGSDVRPTAGEAGREGRPSFSFFLVGLTVFVLVIAPLVGRGSKAVRGQFGWAAIGKTETAFRAENTRNYMDVLAWGTDTDDALRYSGLVFGLLMLVGFVSAVRGKRRAEGWGCGAAFVTAYVGTLLLYYLVDRWIKVRYVLGAFPPGLFLAALGIEAIGRGMSRVFTSTSQRRVGAAAALLIAGTIGIAQTATILKHPVQRDDWRSVVERVEAKGEGSAELLVADWHSLTVLGYYMELAGLHRPVRGLFYNPEEMNSMMDPARDLWVFATHEDWWNIDRGEISDFLTAYTLMPQDLPDLWGVEIRRSRRPEQLVEDRELKPIEVDGGETTAFDLALDGSGSPYLGGGWFTSHPWAAPFYRQKLMATRADLLIPLAVPRSVEIRARLRLRGEPVSRPFEVNLVFGGETVESWHVGSSWATYVVALPAEALDAGLNVVTFTASETLRVPAPEKGEAGQAPSLEVDWMDLTLGGPTVEEAEPSLALGGAL